MRVDSEDDYKEHLPLMGNSFFSAGKVAPLSPASTLEIDEGGTARKGPLREFRHPFSLRQRRWTCATFTLMACLLFADQNLLSPNLSTAAAFFGMNDEQKDQLLGGYISAAFFAVGAPAALLVGWFADKVNRRNLLFAVAIFGQAPNLCTIFVTQFWQFFLLRIMTGVSVGGCFPLLYSLLGDLFPPEHRATVSAFILIATGAGVFIGQMLAGWIGPATDWRMPFVIVSAPAILIAFVMLLTTKEPPRGVCEEAIQAQGGGGADGSPLAVYSERITWAKVRLLMKVPSNWLIVMQGLPGSLPWGMFMTFLNDYFQNQYGLSAGIATTIISVFGIGGGIGVVGGGALSQWLYNKKKEWMPLLSGSCVLVGIGPAMFLVNGPVDKSIGAAFFMAFVGGMFASVAGPCIKATMINVNDPESRGVALALQSLTDDLGKALGPFIVASFISVLGRQAAFNVAVCSWIPCGILITCLVFCMRKDEDAVQARLKWKINEAAAASAASLGDLRQDGRGGYDRGGAGSTSFAHPSLSLPLSSFGPRESSIVYAVPWVPPPDPTIMSHEAPVAPSVMSHDAWAGGSHRSEALLDHTVAYPSPRGTWEAAKPPATAVFIIGDEEEEVPEGGHTLGPSATTAAPAAGSESAGYGRKYIQSLEAGLQMGQEPFIGGAQLDAGDGMEQNGHEARLV